MNEISLPSGRYAVTRIQTESVDARMYGNEFRFINYSCVDYNVKFYSEFGGPTGRNRFPTIRSLKNITVGEKNLLNYCEEGSEILNRYFLDGNCLCGALRHIIGTFKHRVAKHVLI